MWSPLADISSKEKLAASQHLPFPTGREIGIERNNKKDSWFKVYDSYIEELFETENDIIPLEDGTTRIVPLKGKDGSPVLKLKSLTPERIKILAEFLRKVNTEGLSIKGDSDSGGQWKINQALIDEWIGARELDDGIVLETPNALKLLGFRQLHDMSSALLLIAKLINTHNLYLRTADGPTREKMAKNMCLWTMYQVCSTASNLTELMTGVDVATGPIKLDEKAAKKLGVEPGAVAQSPYGNNDAHAAPGNYFTIHSSFQEGLVGKQCVGIGAVSIKVNSTTQYYMDTLLREGSEEDKQRILFPKVNKWGRRNPKGERAYYIGGKYYYGLANLYDKNSETAELREVDHPSGVKINLKMAENSDDIIRLLASILSETDITPNVAMSLAAMLSVAVDNAKDLALAKINAGPKMFGLYAYGISLGMDIRDLAKIINTPQGRAIGKICEGNVVNGQMGAFSALQAIRKLEGDGIYRDLTLFNLTGILRSDSPNPISAGVVFNNKVKKTASEVIQVLMEDYYTNNIAANENLKHTLEMLPNIERGKGGINTEPRLDNMVYLISILGKMKECIAYMTSENNPLWQLTINLSNQLLENSLAWQASLYLLTDYLKQYGDLVYTYYYHTDDVHYYARDLKILSQGAEEMRILGTILSSNKGVKSRTEEGITFIETIENAVIDRKKVMGLKSSPIDRIDYVLFCVDPNYRKKAIESYEEVKHSVNILDVVATAPHFLSYLRACMIPYAAYKVGSAKFRARDRYYRPVVDTLNLTKSTDKENAIRGIEAAVNDRMLREWLTLEQMQFMLPAGGKLFVGRDLDALTVSVPTPVPLWTTNGLATFKNYMEEEIIPKLRSNPNYSNNSFIHGLTPFELTKTGTHATVTAYTLDGNMLPYTESQIVLMETYRADFEQMFDYAFPGHNSPELRNTIPSYADAFYIYSQYVFGGKKGQRSLMALFDNGECSLANRFEAYEAQVDATLDFEFSVSDLLRWCAPNSNIYNPGAELFYATSSTEFGKLLYQKNHLKKPKEESPEGEEASKKSKENEDVVRVGKSLSSLNRQVYITPDMEDLNMTSIAFPTGLNNNTAYYGEFLNVELEPGSGEYWSLLPNEVTGTFSVQPSGPISERAQKILDLVNANLEIALVCIPLLKTGIYMQGVNPRALKALVEEAINEFDNNCK